MYNEQKTRTLNATSSIGANVAVSMFMQKMENGSTTQSINITNTELYEDNKKECDKDIETFKAHAEDL